MAMQIWVDADACPRVIKELLYRAAKRVQVTLTLVANQPMQTPPSPYINTLQVPAGFDVADNRIVELLHPGDLVITADIPLAADVIEKGGFVIDPKGNLIDEENARERLSIRDFMSDLRDSGVETGGPSPFSKGDRQAFANQLDRWLAKHGPSA